VAKKLSKAVSQEGVKPNDKIREPPKADPKSKSKLIDEEFVRIFEFADRKPNLLFQPLQDALNKGLISQPTTHIESKYE
jgi:hypothetical protein